LSPRLSALLGTLFAALLVDAAAHADRGAEIELTAPDGAPVVAAKVRLAGATRDAVRADAGAPVTGAVAGPAGILIASTGIRAAGDGPVVFAIDVERDGAWVEVLAHTAPSGASGWVDHRVELPAEPANRRRLRLRVSAAGAVEAYWGSPRFLPARGGDEPPLNVVVISLDTLGAQYLGSHGGLAEASRNIDAFLSRAYSFRRAYATYPNTLVSHASLFTGLYPASHGVYGSVRDSDVTANSLAALLRAEGYFNAAFTENAFVSSDFGFDRGFDWYDDGPEIGEAFLGDAVRTFGRAREWLQRFGDDGPFFLFVHTYEVHSPYLIRNAESRRIADAVHAAPAAESEPVPESVADTEHLHNAGFARLSRDTVRRLEAVHVGEIHYLDQVFADLIGAIERMPFAGRTLIVVLSDHGDEFDPDGMIGHGETLADVVMHVPLAFYLPGRIGTGEYEQPVSLVDVAPTVLDLLGRPGALSGDGRSLLPLLNGTAAELEPRPVFAELQKASATCAAQRLPETCFVGRFVVYAGTERFESSMIPHYERLQLGAGGENVRNPSTALVEPYHALLSAYVTGAPWASRAPWRPQSVEVDAGARPAIDDVTRQRLEALGYDF
jgi:arylsulfatase A-like enzyme